MAEHGQHKSASAEWWTPPEIVNPARELFGGFGLDAASCAAANKLVQAREFFTADSDGLGRPWESDVVWCNPPSKAGENAAWEWWVHGSREWASGRICRLFFMVFNPSSFFQVAQSHSHKAGVPSPQMACRVEFRKRIRYLRATKQTPLFDEFSVERGDAPPHGSALLLLSSNRTHFEMFAAKFAPLGDSVCPLVMPVRMGAS